MANKVFKPAQIMIDLSKDSREKLALNMFDYETINKLIAQAAIQGRTRVQIIQELPLSLDQTKAVENITKKLKRQKYNVTWVHAAQREESNKSFPVIATYQEMVISWGEKQRESYKMEFSGGDE